jgi:hypothetical protein
MQHQLRRIPEAPMPVKFRRQVVKVGDLAGAVVVPPDAERSTTDENVELVAVYYEHVLPSGTICSDRLAYVYTPANVLKKNDIPVMLFKRPKAPSLFSLDMTTLHTAPDDVIPRTLPKLVGNALVDRNRLGTVKELQLDVYRVAFKCFARMSVADLDFGIHVKVWDEASALCQALYGSSLTKAEVGVSFFTLPTKPKSFHCTCLALVLLLPN